MKGDFSRLRFSRGKGYTAVVEQQGRVALDADANEQRFIDETLVRAETCDVIGEFGAPECDGGFSITIDDANNKITIGKGRYYVHGVLVENPSDVEYDSQPFLPVPPGTTAELLTGLRQGKYALQFCLRVWQRLVTALDDPCLREPALGQADTTARLQTVWQVIVNEDWSNPEPAQGACCAAMYKRCAAPPPASTGNLTVTNPGFSAECGCGPVATAGYQGLENQLYRVEIHGGGDTADGLADGPTFKWSRENGSVVSAVTGISGATVYVDSLGPDANLGFGASQWVELSDDWLELGGLTPNAPGQLYQIQTPNKDDPSLTLNAPVNGIDVSRNARVRRWDQSGDLAASAGAIPVPPGTLYPLENGIQVMFSAGVYQSGDYWTFPARTATGKVEWPPCGSDRNTAQPPQSVEVLTAPLACAHWSAEDKRIITENCRTVFSPLTALTPPAVPKAIHVQSISWVNDDIMTLDQLVVNGLTVTLDQAVSGPVNGANFIVTLEYADLSTHFTTISSVVLLDSWIAAPGPSLAWLMPDASLDPSVVEAIQVALSTSASEGIFARVRVRLMGEMLFAVGAAGPIYLDGRGFGQVGTRQDGVTQRVDLRFASDCSSAASDLESWFYLAPVVTVNSVSVAYSSLNGAEDGDGNFLGVAPTPTSSGSIEQIVNQVATIQLNYPNFAPVRIDLTLTSDKGGVGSIVSIPASVSVPSVQAGGRGVVQFPVTISSAVLQLTSTTPINFTITASPSVTFAPLTQPQSVSFALVGPPIAFT